MPWPFSVAATPLNKDEAGGEDRGLPTEGVWITNVVASYSARTVEPANDQVYRFFDWCLGDPK